VLDEIIKQLQTSEKDSTEIPESRVRAWMSSEDMEVLGATYSLLSKKRPLSHVVPPLSFDDLFAFYMRYFELCIRNDPQGTWVDDRFTAGCDFVNAFVSFWDEGCDKRYLSEMKSLLGKLYIGGSPEVKRSIVQAIVEHLFERDEIRQFFRDWQDDPGLEPAYGEVTLWAKGGGKSPLTRRRQSQE